MTHSSDSIGKSPAQPSRTPKASRASKSKAVSTRPAPVPRASQPPSHESSLGQLVRLHAVSGLAIIYLPPPVQSILGDAFYDECQALVARFEIGLIIRRGDVLIDVALPIRVLSQELVPPYAPTAAPAVAGAPGLSTAKSSRRRADPQQGSGHD